MDILKRIVGTIALAFLSVALSLFFKHELGAPNYGLGMVIGVTLICYFYGLIAAILGLGLAVVGDYLLAIEAADISALPRLITIALTIVVTCGLVVFLQNARRDIAMRNSELNEVQKQLAQALAYERNIAGTLQQAFLPKIPERIGEVLIAAMYEAGSEEARIGGDFYDVLQLDKDKYMIAIGDVSGKGIDAARQAAAVRYGLRSCILESGKAVEAFQRLNGIVLMDPQFDGFATIFAGILDTTIGKFTYSNGGHEPPILYRSGTGEYKELRTTGMMIGAFQSVDFTEDEILLEKGDVVLLYTDGLSEARNNGGMLGIDGLVRLLSDIANKNVVGYLDRIASAARDYSGGYFRDDVAAILLSIP